MGLGPSLHSRLDVNIQVSSSSKIRQLGGQTRWEPVGRCPPTNLTKNPIFFVENP